MIEFRNVSKTYKSKKKVTTEALKNVSFTLPNTGMVFILGKSGSGKSTLLNILGGLDNCDSGEIYVDSKKISNFKENDYDYYRNTYVGFIFQYLTGFKITERESKKRTVRSNLRASRFNRLRSSENQRTLWWSKTTRRHRSSID